VSGAADFDHIIVRRVIFFRKPAKDAAVAFNDDDNAADRATVIGRAVRALDNAGGRRAGIHRERLRCLT